MKKPTAFWAAGLAAAFAGGSPAWATPTLTTLVNFNGTNGENPFARLVADASGNLFGTTVNGGTSGDGTVFELQLVGKTYTFSNVMSFNGTNGANPYASLTPDAAGELYGTTYAGGTSGDGTVFKLAAKTYSWSNVITFNGTNGANPEGTLISDTAGDLYGTTETGGTSNDGTVFEVPAKTTSVSNVMTFNGANGQNPHDGLVADAAGNLYGTSYTGGANGCGTVFEVAAKTNVASTVGSLTSAYGANPIAGLAIDAAGNLYGSTCGGGASGDGAVYEVAAMTHTLSNLVSFNGTNADYAHAGLLVDAAGNLFGATVIGGAYGDGALFEVPAGTHTLTTLFSFNGTNGENPTAGLVADASGNLWGTTYNGGTSGDGTVFELSGAGFVLPQLAAGLTWNNAGCTGDGCAWDIAYNPNWNNGTSVSVYCDGAAVNFTDNNGGHYAVTLNTTVCPGSVNVNNSSGNYTISGSGGIAGTGSLTKSGTSTLTLSTVNAYTGGTIVNAGVLLVGVNGALPIGAVTIAGGTLQLGAGTGLAQLTSLSITGSGTLDINNNHLIINYGNGPDPISAIAAYLKSGYNGGAWNGPGIISSAPLSTGRLLYGVGYADFADRGNPAQLSAGRIEVKYTLLGDCNLDGKVDVTDFSTLAANFGDGVTGWDQGDFTYSGMVNGTDFSDLAENFGQGASGAAVSAADVAALDAFAAANGLLANIPEPASLSLIGLASATLLIRRRRTHR